MGAFQAISDWLHRTPVSHQQAAQAKLAEMVARKRNDPQIVEYRKRREAARKAIGKA